LDDLKLSKSKIYNMHFVKIYYNSIHEI